MAEYLVKWEIDIEADSPVQAAQKARAIQLRFDSTATVFEALEKGESRALSLTTVDLLEEQAPPAYEKSEMNESRAAWAEAGIQHYVAQKADSWNCEEPDTWLGDFLCDLRHYAQQAGLDFDAANQRGATNFAIEAEGIE